MYAYGSPNPQELAQQVGPLYRVLKNRYYVDELYLFLIDKLVYAPARFLAEVDYNFIDQFIVDGCAAIATKISRAKGWFDDHVIDGWLVNGSGTIMSWGGQLLRSFQNGFAQFYLLVVVAGVGMLILWALGTLQPW